MTDTTALRKVAKAAEELVAEYKGARPGVIGAIKSERKARAVLTPMDCAVAVLEEALRDAAVKEKA